jgi:hypothetical protein
MKKKYISENTLEFVSLHDCIVEDIKMDKENLVLTFEHIDVLSEHPLNDTGKSMYTGKAQIRFTYYQILESTLYDTSNIQGKNHIIVEKDAKKKVIPISELLTEFEVLTTEEVESKEHYFIHRFDGITSLKYRADFGYFIIKYKKLFIEWNELIDTAWFEKR